MKTTPLDTILFDPLSWMHPQRLALKPGFTDVRQRSIINDMIIEAHGWSTERPVLPEIGLVSHFVHQWRLLPQVALLTACQRHRAALTRQGRLLSLPVWLRRFAQLNIVNSAAAITTSSWELQTLLAWGKYELAVCGQPLPEAIRQRISLLFPPDPDRDDNAWVRLSPNPLLIKLAFQYAKRNPDTPDAAEFRRYCDHAGAAKAATPKPRCFT
ncbi:type III secretion apparatus protein OrgA/MxiK [Sodalis sp. dw_96]|uniref:type III secretion apparatus protein OrgA/MxiK n=1 Tax=Sodalis sp. dw_96 TaxID=2719794 RepID=UPI001BD21F23|nr:type III secretion apparatus protein OrgA/MxiK [Sodalis sp. dw_96]